VVILARLLEKVTFVKVGLLFLLNIPPPLLEVYPYTLLPEKVTSVKVGALPEALYIPPPSI
jgi:hypothetical protein